MDSKLKKESSPYLLQHINNLVDWYTWTETAFVKAISEDKPIFLSIGYSTCHWCHVMSHESFDDPEVAKLLNDHFINIKVDREERPDIDSVYMEFTQAMTGQGGWPMSVFLTPEKIPFFAGTYFPKNKKYGQIGFINLLQNIYRAWKEDKENIRQASNRIASKLNNQLNQLDSELEPNFTKILLEKSKHNLLDTFDNENGGFSKKPKFPQYNALHILMLNNQLSEVTETLSRMRLGGIYDHLRSGFHRYTIDEKWILPHFEKMLYDQAQHIFTYSLAFDATKDKLFKETVYSLLTFLKTHLKNSNGGYYSAIDADSNQEEGSFYTWEYSHLNTVLTKDELLFLEQKFNVKKEGNFVDALLGKKDGENILYLDKRLTKPELSIFEDIKQKLLKVSDQNDKPAIDTKILTDWNSLLAVSLLKAFVAFEDELFLDEAKSIWGFIIKSLYSDGVLFHTDKSENKIDAFLEDYAYLIWAGISLYEITLDISYLDISKELMDKAISVLWDIENNGFFHTNNRTSKLPINKKDSQDNITPSGNSVMISNLLKLSKLFEDSNYESKAEQILRLFKNDYSTWPTSHLSAIKNIQLFDTLRYEIVFALNKQQYNDELKKMIATIPNTQAIVVLRFTDEPTLKFTEEMKMIDEQITMYFCKNYTCEKPVVGLDKINSTLSSLPKISN